MRRLIGLPAELPGLSVTDSMATRTTFELPGFKITKHLGTGAHATINLASDLRSGDNVAIKMIVRRGAEDDRFIAQAENEYSIANRFNHPYLRRCRDLIRERKWLVTRRLFLIMDFVEGETLERHPPGRLRRVPGIFVKVAEGLHALHKLGFIHADIKPNNIIMNAHGDLRIIDFGQSCPLGHRKDRVQGTPDYIAPEQVARYPLDQRTDVFNLGATLYWVVTRKPFSTALPSQSNKEKLVDLRASRENIPPHDLNPKVPLPLSRLIMRCCETEPAQRPRDMREVIAGLELAEHMMSKEREREKEKAPDDPRHALKSGQPAAPLPRRRPT